jgi:uncharacterized protein (DUF697 family)
VRDARLARPRGATHPFGVPISLAPIEKFVARTINSVPTDVCSERARALVHRYAVAGTAWAILPIPVATSVGLTAMETHLLYWIGRIYGENPTSMDVAMTAAGLEVASVALKAAAIEAAIAVPVIGWGIKGAIAGSAIEALGEMAIRHYEQKYPGKRAVAA